MNNNTAETLNLILGLLASGMAAAAEFQRLLATMKAEGRDDLSDAEMAGLRNKTQAAVYAWDNRKRP